MYVPLTLYRHAGYRVKPGTGFVDPAPKKRLKNLDSG